MLGVENRIQESDLTVRKRVPSCRMPRYDHNGHIFIIHNNNNDDHLYGKILL